jgi:hypothetical protein
MPRKYDQETKSKAIRLFIDHVGAYGSEWEAIVTVAGRLGSRGAVGDERALGQLDADLFQAVAVDPRRRSGSGPARPGSTPGRCRG